MPVHVVIPTHTTRHLAACIAALGLQTLAPASVTVTCDTDDPAIAELLDAWWPRIAAARTARGAGPLPPLRHVSRPHMGEPRLNQVRNNGLRALDAADAPAPADLVLILDGDTMLDPGAIAAHAALAAGGAELVIPFRVNLDPERTAAITPESLLEPSAAAHLAQLAHPAERRALDDRHVRYERQLRARRGLLGALGLVKPHKPKVLGGHHAVSVRAMRAVNGYDELYTGYGYDDDDLARRLHALKPPPKTAIAVRTIYAYHLWHPTRAPTRPTDAPGYARFSAAGWTAAARAGWSSPVAQSEPRVRRVHTGA